MFIFPSVSIPNPLLVRMLKYLQNICEIYGGILIGYFLLQANAQTSSSMCIFCKLCFTFNDDML
jgi:hypothetical protein